MQSRLRVSKTTIFLCGFILFAQFIFGLNASRVGVSTAFQLWYAIAFFWALSWWFINDSRNHNIKWINEYLDKGLFLYVAWMFLIPYYLFKTRGWKKALLMIGAILGLFFGAYIIGFVTYSIANIIF